MSLEDALGRTLAEPVSSSDDVPGFDNSAMDGFAIRASDTRPAPAPARLRVVGESRAGGRPTVELGPGEAARISTGAMIPAGADAVVRVEDTSEHAGAVVEVLVAVAPGRDIRRAGEDIRAGELVLDRGRRLDPAALGVAASVGAAELLCTPGAVDGDGVDRRRADSAGRCRSPPERSGTPTRCVAGAGQARRRQDDRSRDGRRRPPGHRAALRRALEADVAVVTGGVSVGPHDHVKPALAELGVAEVFWGVALRPGKPTWFGTLPRGDGGARLVFGLPGNPVSAMVTFHLFARPALVALAGGEPGERRSTAVMDADYAKSPGRAHAVRCRLEQQPDGWHVRPTKEQGSHVLTSMLDAEALASWKWSEETWRPANAWR